MSGVPRPATATPSLRLVLALDGSLGEVLELLGVRAAPAAAGPRPGLLQLVEPAGERRADTSEGLPGRSGGLAGVELLVADPWDVPVLVERGVADVGMAPKHVLAELQPDLFEVLDLQVAEQRLAHVAAPGAARPHSGRRLRLATAHPRLTGAHFDRAGVQVETLALRSAAELAAALGAVDGAVVLLPPGARQTAALGPQTDALIVQAEVLRSSARLVVNRSARLVRAVEVSALVDGLRSAVRSRASGRTGNARSPSDSPTAQEA